MNLITTIAVGEPKWAQMALNLCLSIKSGNPDQKTLLITEPNSIKGIEPLIEKYFDYIVFENCYMESFTEFAFHLKTQLYKIVFDSVKESHNVIFLDADTIMLPSKNTDEWFIKHEGRVFTAYCNDIYDYKTKKRNRSDYTFWCEPEQVKEILGFIGNKIPQINSSFLYFEKGELARKYFQTVSDVWDNDNIQYIKYKNYKPDELCFNIASAITNILPHQSTYRPIFFQFGSEQQSIGYIFDYFKSFGFAGDKESSDTYIALYNEISDYFRQKFGVIENFKYSNELSFYDNNHLKLKYLQKRTLFRQGEVNGSEGGIFNPDAIINNGMLVTIFRKEENFDVYKNIYSKSSATPFVYIDESDSFDLIPVGFPENTRIEDFRLFIANGLIWCNHKVVSNITKNSRDMKTCLSIIDGDKLINRGIPKLPVKMQRMDINWSFFYENGFIYCVYSLSPYRVFVSTENSDYKIWDEVELPKTQLDWFHKGQFICNSTNPILIDGSYLMFFHTKHKGIYFHGACLIDAETKRITHYTRNSFDIKASNSGRQKGLLYVSGCIYLERENIIRVFAGDCDVNSIYFNFHKDMLMHEIKKYPV